MGGEYAKSHRESAITATLRDLAVFGKKKKREIPGRMKKINTEIKEKTAKLKMNPRRQEKKNGNQTKTMK